jgi:hypothetical protein
MMRYQRNPELIFRKIVDEAVLVPIHQNVANMDCIYTLNDVGAFIWDVLQQPASLEDLVKDLLQEYDADPDVLKADLSRFLSEMQSIGALEEVKA